jgi:hypothetical protein
MKKKKKKKKKKEKKVPTFSSLILAGRAAGHMSTNIISCGLLQFLTLVLSLSFVLINAVLRASISKIARANLQHNNDLPRPQILQTKCQSSPMGL